MTSRPLPWLLSLGRKFLAVATWPTLFAVCAAVTSQVLVAVASFLPFKALALAVRDSSSVHLWHAEHIERRLLIGLLCLLAFACYAVHLFCQRQLEKSVSHGAQTLMQHTRKLGLFDKQESIAESGYRRFALGGASLLIALICLAVLAGWNRPLLWGVLAYTGALLLALPLALRSEGCRQWLDDRLEQVLEAAGGLGFVSSFVYLVVEFIGTQHALMVGVGSLIVVRQFFRSLVALLRAGVELWRKRLQLTALFFQHQVLIEQGDSEDFWQLFEPARRQVEIEEGLQRLFAAPLTVQRINWLPSGSVDVVALAVEASVGGQLHSLCLRLFNLSRLRLARHEATLLSAGLDLPRHGFLGALQLRSGFPCHVFEMAGFRQVDGKALTSAMTQLRRQLLYREPPAELVSTYGRSKSYLWQRLNAGMALRLRHVLGATCHDAALACFEAELDSMCAQLRRLPLAIAQPGMGKGNVLSNERGQALLCSWDRWLLDSVGYAWPADSDERLEQLEAALHDAAGQRKDLSPTLFPLARLCALLAAFEHHYQRQDYSAALQLLARAMDVYQGFIGTLPAGKRREQ